MPSPDASSVIQKFSLTHRVIQLQTDGLTHADSLLQPPFRGNCLNWVLGHIIEGRNNALRALGAPPVWSESEASRYKPRSEPIVRDERAIPFERLMSDLAESQRRIEAALTEMLPEGLAAAVDTGDESTPLGEHLAWLHWHETYHVGQLELLRQLAGKNDAVI
jgi:hypothetical protein